MNYAYEGIMTIVEDDGEQYYDVRFPDWPSATYGMTLDEAIYMATDFIKANVSARLTEGLAIPKATFGHDTGDGTRILVSIDMDKDSADDYWAWTPVSNAAEELGVTEGRVRAMVRDGVLPSIREHGKIYVSSKAVQERLVTGAKRGRPAKDLAHA